MSCLCCIYTFCRYVCSCMSTPVKQLTHIGLHLLIPVGERKKAWKHVVVMTGGGILVVRVCWLRWVFIWEQKSLALRRRFPDAALSGRLAVPRHTYPHAASLAHLVCSSKGCFFSWLLCSAIEENVVVARQTYRQLIFHLHVIHSWNSSFKTHVPQKPGGIASNL